MMKSCPCKSERPNCSKGWWKYSEISFCHPQILWILDNLELLGEGKWPSEPIETGYVGGSGRRVGNASFERPVIISGEVEWRIARCPMVDGAMLYQKYVLKISDGDIAKSFHCSDVTERVERVLVYITGFRRKREYSKWVWDNRKGNPKRVLTK